MEEENLAVNGNGKIIFSFPDEQSASAAAVSLEGEGNVGSRTSTQIKVDGKTVEVLVKSEDVVSMRAALNGILRALQAFESIENRINR